VTIPLAALAVMRAALEDSATGELLMRPGWTAHRLAVALERAGWTITPTGHVRGAQTPPQAV
jgi:hypothetical protein